jgi:dUTP pyrophosphatase
MQIKIKLKPGAKIPYRSSTGAAGWDLFAYLEQPVTIEPLVHHRYGKDHPLMSPYMIPTGVYIELPPGTFWDVRIRSGLAAKHGLILANGAGVVDEDYRGEVFVPIVNLSNKPYVVQPGEKIAQAILMRYEVQEFQLVDELSDTDRGTSGFGSTGRGI